MRDNFRGHTEANDGCRQGGQVHLRQGAPCKSGRSVRTRLSPLARSFGFYSDPKDEYIANLYPTQDSEKPPGGKNHDATNFLLNVMAFIADGEYEVSHTLPR